jgi:hypothetical protein
MSFSVSIGIITYNRIAILTETIDRVGADTDQSDAAFVATNGGACSATSLAGSELW